MLSREYYLWWWRSFWTGFAISGWVLASCLVFYFFVNEGEKDIAAAIYFVIMANVFNTTKHINVRYDLKGSKYKRKTRVKGEQVDSSVALKDLDFDNDKVKIDCDPEVK